MSDVNLSIQEGDLSPGPTQKMYRDRVRMEKELGVFEAPNRHIVQDIHESKTVQTAAASKDSSYSAMF